MSVFSDILSNYIIQKQTKVLSLARYCELDRSTMYKLMNGKRNPPSREILEKMAHFMHLTPVEFQHLEEAWNISRTGASLYYKRKSVENFITHFPSQPVGDADLQFFTLYEQSVSQDSGCTVLSSQQHINYQLHQMLLKECGSESGKIALFLQSDYDFLFKLLAALPASAHLQIDHILCLTNKDEFTKEHELVNLKYLYTIFPLYFAGLNYKTWFFYDKIHSHYHNFNLFPCMILTSEAAITCTADYQSGLLYNSPEILDMLWQMFYNYQNQCQPLFRTTVFTPENYMEVFQSMFYSEFETSPLIGIQPEACITPFLSGQMLQDILNREIPEAALILSEAEQAFRKNMNKLSSHQFFIYFTAGGMMQFAKTGRTEEIPDIFYRTLTKNERIVILEGILNCCQNGTYRILQKPLNSLPRNLHLCICGNTGTMIFRCNNGQSVVLTVNEYSLINTFQDYLENMEDSSFYTPKDAVAFIRQLIDSLKE